MGGKGGGEEGECGWRDGRGGREGEVGGGTEGGVGNSADNTKLPCCSGLVCLLG